MLLWDLIGLRVIYRYKALNWNKPSVGKILSIVRTVMVRRGEPMKQFDCLSFIHLYTFRNRWNVSYAWQKVEMIWHVGKFNSLQEIIQYG